MLSYLLWVIQLMSLITVIHIEALPYVFVHPLYFSVFSECDILYFYLFHTLMSVFHSLQ